MDETPRRRSHFQRNLIAGLLTIAPLFAVWLVFNFLLGVLSTFGAPLAAELTIFIDQDFPAAAPWLADPRVRLLLAVIVALLVLYGIGAVASRVIGQRVIGLFERVISRIPLVQTIYSAAKKLVDVLQQRPGNDQRVALIDWPREGMKTIGIVMRSFNDAKTGAELAAIYVPSALNPTSGFLEIVPIADIVFLDITTDQAMAMIISGGAIVPERLSIARSES
jgi:uncharacterized membrane protein